jgi:ribosomal protein S18 acetylase RimI-like enzyme
VNARSRPRGSLASVRVRAARESDIEAAAQLFRRLDQMERKWRIFQPRPGSLNATRVRYQRLLRDKTGIVVVAQTGEQLVGLGVGEVSNPSSYSDVLALDVSNVYVLPAFRGRGIATRIIARLLAHGSARDAKHVVLRVFAPNDHAAEFWAGLAFRPRLTQFVAPIDQVSTELASRRRDGRS